VALWIAAAFGCLALAGVREAPLMAGALTLLFFGTAWGIRARQGWAAVLGAYLALAPALAQAMRWDPQWLPLALASAVSLACAPVFLREAKRLGAERAPVRAALPWA
jgi:hypothetical protein